MPMRTSAENCALKFPKFHDLLVKTDFEMGIICHSAVHQEKIGAFLSNAVRDWNEARFPLLERGALAGVKETASFFIIGLPQVILQIY